MARDGSIKGVQWVLVGAFIIGLIFIISGAITTGIAYTEITPPDYDNNYYRYIGTSVQRLLGPFILAFGGLVFVGSCGFLGFQSFHSYERIQDDGTNRGVE